jgi:hypothetical protein
MRLPVLRHAILYIATLVFIVLRSSSSSADEHAAKVRLEWSSEIGCVDTATVRMKVEEALGRPAFSDGPDADLVLVGRVTRANAGFDAVVTLSRRSGEPLGTRILSSPSAKCDELSLGLPLALALMIDLPLREATIHVVLPQLPAGPPPRTAPLHAALIAGPVVRFGWIPAVALGARLAAEVGLGPVPIGIEATWLAPSLQYSGPISASSWGLSGAVYGCPFNLTGMHWYGGACAYTEVGAIVGQGVNVMSPHTDEAWLVSLGGRLRGGLRWAPWSLGLEVGGGGFLVRPELDYDISAGGRATLVQASAGSLDVFLGAGVWLP